MINLIKKNTHIISNMQYVRYSERVNKTSSSFYMRGLQTMVG